MHQQVTPVAAAPLQSSLLSSVPGVIHGITHRAPGLGLAEGNVAYAAPRDPDDAWRMRQHWCAAVGLDAARLVTVGQIHGGDVAHATAVDAGRGARPGSGRLTLADAIITDAPDVVLFTLHADCLPILLVDPVRPAVATVHAGWRGTVADIAGATVRAMAERFGSRPADLLAYLGPGIGPCCYDVGPEVVRGWHGTAGDDATVALRSDNGITWLDLPTANTWLLRQAGVLADHLELSGICTRCQGDAWFSHRGQGLGTGRFGALIALTDTGGRA